MILINITMPIRPDKMDEWLALADSYAKDVNSEDGCLFFQFARSLANENEFVCIEGFKRRPSRSHPRQTAVRQEVLRHRAGPRVRAAADHLHRHAT